jgi:hypothetical protein
LEVLLDALTGSGAALKTIQMIDSTVIRAHHQGAGAKGGLKARLLAVRAAALRSKFTSAPTAEFPLAFIITPGEAHDATVCDELMDLDDMRPKAVQRNCGSPPGA